MKKNVLNICATIICLCLVSCSNAKYNDTQSCSSLCYTATKALADGLEYAEFGENHKKLYFDDTEEYDDVCILYSTDTNNINEIGIFHAIDNTAAADLEKDCVEYIEDIREGERAFIASYAPTELPKLDGAQVHRYGNYVIYTILPTDSTAKVLTEIEGILKK